MGFFHPLWFSGSKTLVLTLLVMFGGGGLQASELVFTREARGRQCHVAVLQNRGCLLHREKLLTPPPNYNAALPDSAQDRGWNESSSEWAHTLSVLWSVCRSVHAAADSRLCEQLPAFWPERAGEFPLLGGVDKQAGVLRNHTEIGPASLMCEGEEVGWNFIQRSAFMPLGPNWLWQSRSGWEANHWVLWLTTLLCSVTSTDSTVTGTSLSLCSRGAPPSKTLPMMTPLSSSTQQIKGSEEVHCMSHDMLSKSSHLIYRFDFPVCSIRQKSLQI